MGKSIFIIGTPACCGECPMSGTGVCRKWNWKDARSFPKDCPLQDAPKKKGKNPYHNERERGYMDGWNDCLDQILNGGLTE